MISKIMSPTNLIIGAVLWYLYYRGTSFANNLRFQFMGINTQDLLKNIQLFNTKLPVKVKVINPTATPVTISGFIGDLLYNDYALGRINLSETFKIPADSEATIQLTANILNINVLNNLASIIRNGKSAAFKVVGIIKTPLGEIPLPDQNIPIGKHY